MKTIISLTTVPPRLPFLRTTLLSLLSQRAEIHRIILWIPDQYRRSDFNNIPRQEIDVPIEIRSCAIDYGPATKLLPALSLFAGEDVRIIYCDDDRYYHPSWAQLLISWSDRYPEDCISGWGLTIGRVKFYAMNLDRTGLKRVLRPFWWRSVKAELPDSQDVIDIAEGFSGVIVKPKFFKNDVFKIPDTHWMVDDVWLSGHLTVNGIKIRRTHSRYSQLLSRGHEGAGVSALLDYVHGNIDRHSANMRCIEYFQKEYGIWLWV